MNPRGTDLAWLPLGSVAATTGVERRWRTRKWTDPIDAEELRRRVIERRQELGLSLRAAAEDSGVPFNTLSRVEKGHLPDLANFSRLVAWVGLDPAGFFRATPRVRTANTPAAIRASLHADRHLTQQAAEQIAELVTQLYAKLATQVGGRRGAPTRPDHLHPRRRQVNGLAGQQLQDALLADDSVRAKPGWEV